MHLYQLIFTLPNHIFAIINNQRNEKPIIARLLNSFWPKSRWKRQFKISAWLLKTLINCSLPIIFCDQSHYIEVAQGDIFMEQKMWFGLVLGRLAILKKKVWADYEQLLRTVFSCFRVQNFFFWKCCTVRTEKLHNINLRKKKIKFFFLKFILCNFLVRTLQYFFKF